MFASKKYRNSKKINKTKILEESSTEQVHKSEERILLKRKIGKQIEYLIESQKGETWKKGEEIDPKLIEVYDEEQRKCPKINGKELIRICDLQIDGGKKDLLVQLEGEVELQRIPYTFLKLNTPHQLVQFLLSIYNPYL